MSDFSINNNVFLSNYKDMNKSEVQKLLLSGDASADVFESSETQNKKEAQRGFFGRLADKILGYSTECTDANDDGKLNFKEKLSSIGRGTLNMVTNLLDAAVEHPVIALAGTVATVGLSALAISAGIISAPALAVAGGVIGCGFGAFNIIKGIKNAKNAENDTQAKLAYEGIGEGTANIALSALSISKGVKSIKQINSIAKEAATYANQAQSSAQQSQANLFKAKEAMIKLEETQHLSDDAQRINNEILKISDGVASTANDVKRAQSIYSRITTGVGSSCDDYITAKSAFEETRNLAREAQDCAMKAQEAAQAARKAMNAKMALAQRDIAKEAAGRALVCADTTENNIGIIQNCVQNINNNLPGMNSELSALQRALVDIDTKISGFDYSRIQTFDDRRSGFDGFGDFERQDMREDILRQRSGNTGLADEGLQVKAPPSPAESLTPQLPEGSKYYELGTPRIHSKTKQPSYVCPNLQLAADGNGVRGKTPLAGKPGRYTPILNSVKKAGVERIIDLRAEGECSQGARKLLEELGLEYVNFPVDDNNWNADSLHRITEFIQTINKGDYFVGCANGESRTDLAVMINYLLNPESKNVPNLIFGSNSTTKTTLYQNMTKLLDLIKGNKEILSEWGWSSIEEFFKEYNLRYAKLFASIGLKK